MARTPPPVAVFVLLLIYAAFISLGLPDGILGAAWPAMRVEFGAALNDNWLILLLGTAGGMLSSFGSGALLRRLGVGRLLVGTTLLTALTVLGYAVSPGLAVVTGLAFVLGLGNGAIDTGLNHFVAEHLSSRHMNWLHAFWGVGVSLGTLIISGIFANGGTWRTAYLLIGGCQLALAVAFVTHYRALSSPDHAPATATAEAAPNFRATLALPATWASLGFFFVYSGVEFGVGTWIATLLHDGRGWPMDRAALMVSVYWGSLTVGRFLIGAISNRTTPVRIVRWAVLGAVVGTSLIAGSGWVGVGKIAGLVTAAGLMVTGLSLSPIFPMMMHDTPRCVGRGHALNLIGFQSAIANLGISVLPGLMGTALRFVSVELLGPLLLGCALALLAALTLRERWIAPSPSALGSNIDI